MKKLIPLLALIAMAALIGAAVVVDCVRLANGFHSRITPADEDVQKQEVRLLAVLNASPKKSPEVESALKAYIAVNAPPDRHRAYEQLVASFQKTMSGKIDPTNPLDRKFMDETAGAINRRNVAQKEYDEESTAYQNYLTSWRGSVARTFSSQARSDWKESP